MLSQIGLFCSSINTNFFLIVLIYIFSPEFTVIFPNPFLCVSDSETVSSLFLTVSDFFFISCITWLYTLMEKKRDYAPSLWLLVIFSQEFIKLYFSFLFYWL